MAFLCLSLLKRNISLKRKIRYFARVANKINYVREVYGSSMTAGGDSRPIEMDSVTFRQVRSEKTERALRRMYRYANKHKDKDIRRYARRLIYR